jgi:hypothetical protein
LAPALFSLVALSSCQMDFDANSTELSDFVIWTCFYLPTWCTISLFCNICITLNTWTCFEHYYAHPREVKIVFLQHLVSSLSMSGRAVNRLRVDSWVRSQPPEDEHSSARNMSRCLKCSTYITE